MSSRPKVVFFGSGPVAAESLQLLLEWCDVEAVVTKPQPAHHRQEFPVIAVAKQHSVPLHFASNRRELDELTAKTVFESRVAVLIDYGIIVSQQVIDSFSLGIVNSHFSILPEWRGADPISFAILSGQKQTGVSLMMLVQAMDEGPLLGYGEYDLPEGVTTPQLTSYLINLSDSLLQHELPRLITGETKGAAPQTITKRQASYSRKLTKADGVLDFTKPAERLEREIRAFAEWPKSRTQLAGKDVVVTKAHVGAYDLIGATPDAHRAPGVVSVTDSKNIAIQTSDGVLIVERLKPAGKSDMSAAAFLAGNRL